MESTWRARPLASGRLALPLLTMLLVALVAAAGMLVGSPLVIPPGPRLNVAPPSITAPEAPLLAFAASPTTTSSSNRSRFHSQLYVVRADGSDGRVLGMDGRPVAPVWSPDGSRIAFSTIEGSRHQLRVIDPDGQVLQLADAPTCGEPGSPAWSPDGRYLLYAVGAPDSNGHCAAVINHVFVVPADGSAPGRPLLADGTDLYTLSPAWGPSGIAMQGNDGRTAQLLVADVPDPDRPWDLTARRIDAEPAGPDAFTRPSWSPDGRSIATTYVAPGLRLSSGVAAVYPVNGEPATLLGPDGERLILPSWAPDGTWLVALARGEAGYHVVVLDRAGAIVRTIPTAGVDPAHGTPLVSPDGRWIAARSADDQGEGAVLVVDAAGGSEPLTIPALGGGGFSWQPVANPRNPAADAPAGLPSP